MTTPVTEAERRGLQALGQAMDELRQAQAAPADPVRLWSRTMHVLNLMHSLDDQAHKRLGPDYREVTRRASEDGRTQAALTLVRGIAHHHGSEVQAHVFREPKMYVGDRPVLEVYLGDQEASVRVAMLVWSPLSALPASTEKTHGRDAYYAEHVEGRGLMEPLLAAQRFMAGLHQ